jgi:small ligand-binding sensory domain FIST
MPFAAALSEHPITAHAVGEVTGAVLEQLGERPDAAFVFVTPPHAGALEDVAGAVAAVLCPLALVGCAAESVVGPHREVEHHAAVSLLAARTGPVLPIALDAVVGPDGLDVRGWPDRLGFAPRALVLLADPFSFPTEPFLAWVEARVPGLPVVGGMASAARGPGGNRLALGPRVRDRGAVGVLLGPGVDVETVVSQGCRPFGRPLVVTRAERNLVVELAGRPALERLAEQAELALGVGERSTLELGGLHIGVVIDEHGERFGRGDFLVRNVLGADGRTGALVLGDTVAVGTTVQFHLRDADSATEDLRLAVAGRRAGGVLLFTCTGRGSRLFDTPSHDVGIVAEHLGPVPVAGCFAAGEIGPVGGKNFVHGFTASMALLRDSPDRPEPFGSSAGRQGRLGA